MELKWLSIIGLILFIYLVYTAGINNIISALSSANLVLLLFAFLLNPVTIFLKSEKWRILIDAQGYKYSKLKSFLTWLIGLSYGIITPSRSGELIKIFYLEKQIKMPKSKGIISTLTDRIIDMFSLMIVALIGSSILSSEIKGNLSLFLFAYMAVLIIVFIIFTIFINNKNFFKKVLKPVRKFKPEWHEKLINSYDNVLNAYNVYVKKKKTMIKSIFLSITAWAFIYYQAFLVTEAFSLNLSFWQVLSVFPVTTLVSILPISIAGLGTREATLILLIPSLTLHGIIPMSLVLSIITIWIPVLIGFLITNIPYLEK